MKFNSQSSSVFLFLHQIKKINICNLKIIRLIGTIINITLKTHPDNNVFTVTIIVLIKDYKKTRRN